MPFNYSKLLGRFREYGFTQKDVAAHIGVGPTTLSLKLNNKATFTSSEIDSMCKLLDIAKEDIGIYFFTV
jgi:transcriptional regulator with XRE-family HTH domain